MDTEKNRKVQIKNSDGTTIEVELVTYLISEDKSKKYLVYSQNEKVNAEEEVIYISRIISEGDNLRLEEIVDDIEWLDVQKLLKKIANS